MPSDEYNRLGARISDLKQRFVAFSISPEAGEATQEQLDSIACFKLLSHSEIEWFIEVRVLSALDNAVKRWRENQTWSPCIAALIQGWGVHSAADFSSYRDLDSTRAFEEIVSVRERQARQEIGQNHSIKQEAFLRLTCIAGIHASEHSPELLGALESFGGTRGDVAHKPVGRVRTLNAPEVEAEGADQLLGLLAVFDEAIDRLNGVVAAA